VKQAVESIKPLAHGYRAVLVIAEELEKIGAANKLRAMMRKAENRPHKGSLGYRHSPETLALISSKLMGRVGYWKGRKRDPRTVEKIRAAKLANPTRYWLGKKRDPATTAKANATKAIRGVPRPPDHIIEALKISGAASAAKRRKPIKCVQTGISYESCRAAAIDLGFHITSIRKVAAGQRKQIRGMEFVYA